MEEVDENCGGPHENVWKEGGVDLSEVAWQEAILMRLLSVIPRRLGGQRVHLK